MTPGAVSDDPRLLVSRDWTVVAENPKAAVLERRLKKTRARLESWGREVGMLDALVRRHSHPGARLLDVACGTGFNALELAQRGYRTTGLEADPALCALTNAAAAEFSLSTTAICGDACRLPFSDGVFDVVMSHSFFEHVYDRELALGEQIRVLRRGGVLIIIDGNLLNPRVVLNLLVFYPIRSRGEFGGLKWLFGKGKVHKNLYGYLPLGRDEDIKTPRSWRRRLEQRSDCRVVEAGTSARYTQPSVPRFLRPFVGACQVVAVKA